MDISVWWMLWGWTPHFWLYRRTPNTTPCYPRGQFQPPLRHSPNILCAFSWRRKSAAVFQKWSMICRCLKTWVSQFSLIRLGSGPWIFQPPQLFFDNSNWWTYGVQHIMCACVCILDVLLPHRRHPQDGCMQLVRRNSRFLNWLPPRVSDINTN